MSLKVAYLDDEIELCSIFSEIFTADDVQIITYQDPLTAISQINKNPPDLVFLDFRLPKMTGDQVAKMLDKSIPKALITGDLNITPEYPFDKIFNKPFDVSEVQQFIMQYSQVRKAV